MLTNVAARRLKQGRMIIKILQWKFRMESGMKFWMILMDEFDCRLRRRRCAIEEHLKWGWFVRVLLKRNYPSINTCHIASSYFRWLIMVYVCIWSVVLKRSPRDKEPFLGAGTNRRDSPNSCVSLLTVTCLCLCGYFELRICAVIDRDGWMWL